MQLASVSLIVPDYDAAIAVYCGQMGFELIADIDQSRKRWVEVRPPGGAQLLCWRARMARNNKQPLGIRVLGGFGCSCKLMILNGIMQSYRQQAFVLKKIHGMNPMARLLCFAIHSETAGI